MALAEVLHDTDGNARGPKTQVRARNAPRARGERVDHPVQCFSCSPDRAGKWQIRAKQRVVKEVDPRAVGGTAVSVQPVLNKVARAPCVRGAA